MSGSACLSPADSRRNGFSGSCVKAVQSAQVGAFKTNIKHARVKRVKLDVMSPERQRNLFVNIKFASLILQ